MAERTLDQLRYMQAMPLNIKLAMTKTRIHDWIMEYGEDGVYVSFSGGKDSTVLLDIVRSMYPGVKAMFVDVPTQYPELKQFATSFENVDIVKPKLNFFDVCEKYGFPLISKEVSQKIYEVRRNPNCKNARCFIPESQGGRESQYNLSKYAFLLDANFSCSHQCCAAMKKNPAALYEKNTGKKPLIATMASESRARAQKWLQHGCNSFNGHRPKSQPMSFWTEQDVLLYIKLNNLPICSVYGDVVVDNGEQVEGQTNIFELYNEMELFEKERPCLKTTGCDRTGCVLCAFGAHLEESPNRFEKLKITHPNWYKMLDVAKNNGVTYREAIEWVNKNSNIKINL